MGYVGVISHLLTIDPNFLGHPSSMIPYTNQPARFLMAHLLDLGNGNLQNTTARAARNARVGGGVNISDGVYGTILDLVILPNKQSIYNRTSSSWLVVSRICLRYLEKVKHILPNGGLYLPRYKVIKSPRTNPSFGEDSGCLSHATIPE